MFACFILYFFLFLFFSFAKIEARGNFSTHLTACFLFEWLKSLA